MTNKQEDELKKFISMKLLTVIDLDTFNEIIKKELNNITKEEDYNSIDNAKVLLFEDNKALIFVDYDCDGYRSGNWHLINVEDFLDKGATKGIKQINSEVLQIEFKNINERDYVLITTKDYIISLGQDNSDSYYPNNFFDIEECKNYVLGKMRLIK